MKRRILKIFICGVLLIGITGCGNSKEKDDNINNTNKESSQQIESNKNNETKNYVYSVSTDEMTIGNVPTKYGTTYSSAEEIITAFNHNFFVRHTIKDDIITESHIGFKYDDKFYYLKGLDKDAYDENKNIMKNVFGKDKCSDNTTYLTCQGTNLLVTIRDDGYVMVNDSEAYCQAFDDYSKCRIGGMH